MQIIILKSIGLILELYFALLTLQETNLDIVIADCTTASASLQGGKKILNMI